MDKKIQALEKELSTRRKLRNERIIATYNKMIEETPEKRKSLIYTEIGALEGVTLQTVRLIVEKIQRNKKRAVS